MTRVAKHNLRSAASTPASGESSLQDEKLRLEIAELRRSHWSRPIVVVPIAVAALTASLSYYLGFFDVKRQAIEVQRERVEIEKFRAEMARDDAAKKKKDLDIDVEALRAEGSRLAKSNQQLQIQSSELRSQLSQTTTELQNSRDEISKAMRAKSLSQALLAQLRDSVQRTALEVVVLDAKRCVNLHAPSDADIRDAIEAARTLAVRHLSAPQVDLLVPLGLSIGYSPVPFVNCISRLRTKLKAETRFSAQLIAATDAALDHISAKLSLAYADLSKNANDDLQKLAVTPEYFWPPHPDAILKYGEPKLSSSDAESRILWSSRSAEAGLIRQLSSVNHLALQLVLNLTTLAKPH